MPGIGLSKSSALECVVKSVTTTSILPNETNGGVLRVLCVICIWDTRWYLQIFHAAGECRRQVKNSTKFVKNVEIVEFQDRI